MDLKYEFYINGKSEGIWNALVLPTKTRKIYYGCVIQSTFEVGSPLKYVGLDENEEEVVHIHGKVLEFKPNKIFSHSYIVGDAYIAGHEKFESRVTYELEPFGACTKLTVTHDQWIEGDPTYENTAKGYWILLCALKTFIETGNTLELSMH